MTDGRPSALPVIVSDTRSAGLRPDRAAPLLAATISDLGLVAADPVFVPDEAAQLADLLRDGVTAGHALILTSGGTGMTPRDNTPEATVSIIERPAPGIAEALRAEGSRHSDLAWLSRLVAGICADTLIINLPGRPKAITEAQPVLQTLVPHALRQMGHDLPDAHAH